MFIDRDEYVAQAFQKMSESSKNQDAFRDSGCVLYFLLDYIMAKDLEKINSASTKSCTVGVGSFK